MTSHRSLHIRLNEYGHKWRRLNCKNCQGSANLSYIVRVRAIKWIYAANESASHQIPSKVRRLTEVQVESVFSAVDVDQKSINIALTNQLEHNLQEDNFGVTDDKVEYVEESAYGQIIQGEDGQYYVVMDKNTSPDIGENYFSFSDLELDKLNKVQVVTNNDGTETLILAETSKNIVASKSRSVDLPDVPSYNIASTDRAAQGSSSHHSLAARVKDGNDMDGENDEFNVVEQVIGEDSDDSKYSRGLKQRRSRVYGSCRCPECGQSFVNTARLERHLAVHQIFGAYLCPLCGKTYKYEYNLFYHWRKTCRDMNDLLDESTRKSLEVNNLRKMVEEIARKKVEIGSLELGISGQQLYRSSNSFDRGNANNVLARKSATCKECGVTTLEAHMSRHLAIHRGELSVDEKSIGGGYFCELCGLMFREHPNLIKHWRTGCQEIQASLPEYCTDFALDDSALKEMVRELLKKACTVSSSTLKKSEQSSQPNTEAHEHAENIARVKTDHSEDGNDEGKKRRDVPIPVRSLNPSEASTVNDADLIDVVNNQQNEIDERWADDNGIMFADDYMDDDDEVASHMLMVSDEGHLLERVLPHHSASVEQDRLTINETVQCNECYRSFANMARLERHLAGAHCSMGTHHCILCGNRFKYDYNLLYHYRRSCGYTKMWIEPEIREQLDAVELKKLVRNLSNKEVRVSNNDGTVFTNTPAAMGNIMGHRQELGDSLVRRQMMMSVIPISQQQSQSSSFLQIPHNLQLASRPGLPEARQCPICSIAFYGSSVLNRHIKVAHPQKYELWEPSVFDGLEGTSSPSEGMGSHQQGQIVDQVERQHSVEAELEESEVQSMPRQYDIEPPPTLQPESTEAVAEEESNQPAHHSRVASLQDGFSHAQYIQQQNNWAGDEEDIQERIEVIPTRRVIQTRQRTRSGFKEQEINESAFLIQQQRVLQEPEEVSNYQQHHHVYQQQQQQSSHPPDQQAGMVLPRPKPGGVHPSVLRRSTRSTYHQNPHY